MTLTVRMSYMFGRVEVAVKSKRERERAVEGQTKRTGERLDRRPVT